ncbi:MAG: low temperature requirement protein A [Coriobacteriia bacterium]|nr:low temperature requirement protein A [Coriobacteriia bacterium]
MRLWQNPVLRDDAEVERRVQWIELFFDLAFVAVVKGLSEGLAQNVDRTAELQWALYFASMWAVWRYGAIYSDRFETDDLSYRLSLLGLMAAVLVMAVGVAQGFSAGFRLFGAAYVVADVLILILWRRGARHNPTFRPVSKRLTISHGMSIVLWTSAVAMGLPFGWALAAAGTLVDLLAPWLTTRQQDELPSLSGTHLPERFALFTIVVLGECVLAIVTGLSELSHISPITWVASGCILLTITGLYWLYFDQVMTGETPLEPRRRIVRQYLHLPLTASIAAISAIVVGVVEAPLEPFNASSQHLFALGVATALCSIALLESFVLSHGNGEEWLRHTRWLEVIVALAIVVIAVLAPQLPALGFVLVAAIGVALVAGWGSSTRGRSGDA